MKIRYHQFYYHLGMYRLDFQWNLFYKFYWLVYLYLVQLELVFQQIGYKGLYSKIFHIHRYTKYCKIYLRYYLIFHLFQGECSNIFLVMVNGMLLYNFFQEFYQCIHLKALMHIQLLYLLDLELGLYLIHKLQRYL